MNAPAPTNRSTLTVGLFLLTLAFNAGVQWDQISSLRKGQDANNIQIHGLEQTLGNLNVTMEHLNTTLQDAAATRELQRTGAGR
jgi:hypothetical protein